MQGPFFLLLNGVGIAALVIICEKIWISILTRKSCDSSSRVAVTIDPGSDAGQTTVFSEITASPTGGFVKNTSLKALVDYSFDSDDSVEVLDE